MSLKVKLTVSSTDVPEYKEVEFGTYEVEFALEDMAKHPVLWEKLIDRKAGITEDNRLAFLSSIQIRPRMHFGKPIDVENPLGENL